MTWNWNQRKSSIYINRKPTAVGDGENSEEVRKLAEKFIRLGHTRQKAYAKARSMLKQAYRSGNPKFFSAGSVSNK